MIGSILTNQEEADFNNLISSIPERRLPTPEEHEDIVDRLLGLRAFSNCINEDEIFDLIYWTQVYYGPAYSRVFYEVFCLVKNNGSKKRINELLEYASKAIDNHTRLIMRKKRDRAWRRTSIPRHRQMDFAIYRLAKDGLTPGEIARRIGFRKSTVVKILENYNVAPPTT